MKKLTAAWLCVLLLFSLAACTQGADPGESKDRSRTVDPDAPAHEHLMAQARDYMEMARERVDAGAQLQGEYLYGYAQAEISSLRLAVDNLLWLKGEGETLSDVIGAAPYADWDGIVAAGMASPAPHYFEGLVYQVQGKQEEADLCYEKAQANPYYTQRDFYYLKNESVEALYALRKELAPLERELAGEYDPRTALLTPEGVGFEYAADYHLSLAEYARQGGEDQLAFLCARNALCVAPTEAEGYGAAAVYGMGAGELEQTGEILSEGLWIFPEDAQINYLSALLATAGEDGEGAQGYLKTAMKTADGVLLEQCQALLEQLGGDAP